jgi:hypothetical protein
MSGPFSLRYLHLFVRERTPGAFILSRNGRSADFVGKSVEYLAEALRQHIRRSDYRYFWFVETRTAEEAAHLEYTWHHRYHPTDNSSPPAVGQDSDWHCTTEGCAACALAQARR